MSLPKEIQDLIRRKLVKQETIRDDQIVKLLIRSGKDIKTAEANLEIDEEAAFTYAYLAMLRAGRALMFSYGYRPIDGSQHWTVGEFTRIVLTSEVQNIVEQFDDMRRSRNQFTYDPDIPISETEAKDAIDSAKKFTKCVETEIYNIKPEVKKAIE